jgi:hypothetical protein
MTISLSAALPSSSMGFLATGYPDITVSGLRVLHVQKNVKHCETQQVCM